MIMLFVSCEDDQISNDIYEAKNNNYPNITTYLNNEYPSGYRFGVSREFNTNGNTFVVKEVFKSSSSQVNAFINLTNGDFTHFLKLNRSNKVIEIKNFKNNSSMNFGVRNDFSKNLFSRSFLKNISYAKDIGRFWGWSCSVERNPSLNPADCYRTCCYKVMFGSVYCDDYGCDDLPGTNPRLAENN